MILLLNALISVLNNLEGQLDLVDDKLRSQPEKRIKFRKRRNALRDAIAGLRDFKSNDATEE